MVKSMLGWLNVKVILGALVFAVCVFSVFVVVLWSAHVEPSVQTPATALLQVIEAPTGTSPALTSTTTSTIDPSSTKEIPLPSGDIKVGDYVQVSGTGGDGLRLHISAGVDSDVDYIAIDSEFFLVKEGPIDTDGYIWWLLQDPYSEKTVGWGVSNYLSVVQNP
jgi:hypothetical protein